MFISYKKKCKELELKAAELKLYEQSIAKQMDDLNKTIAEAKEYLALCGITEKEIENIRIRNRLKVIK